MWAFLRSNFIVLDFPLLTNAEMKMISGASKDTVRKSELSKRDSPPTESTVYVVINKGVGQQEGITQREVRSNGGSSPTESSSVCSEAAAVSTPQALAKVTDKLCCYVNIANGF